MNAYQNFERDGFAVIPDFIDEAAIDRLIGAVEKADIARSKRGEDVYGARNILENVEIASLSREPKITSLVESLIGPDSRAVRGIFFDKIPGANWPVAWHQDLSLAVAEHHDVEGWGNWSIKAGVQHVQPPAAVLERMVTLRIQLDENDTDNAPLRVLPGTHRLGRIAAEKLKSLRVEIPEYSCIAPAGSALAIKPLILHASSAAKTPKHRRVIHIEFAPKDLLPPPLIWAFAN